jgi:hypothetical protein
MIKKVRIQFALVLVFLFGISTILKAQPGNLPAPYCMPSYVQSPCNQPGPSNMPGNFLNDFIHSVLTFSGNVNINNPNTGCNAQIFPSIGIKNYIYHKCQHNLSVSAGQVISFSIQIGQINAQGVTAFIDWNNDNIFSAAPEKIGWSTGTVPAGGWLTFTTTIPPAQPNGTYRLRIRCAMGINGSTIDPCTIYSSGEVEDYDVYVGTTSPAISNVVASSNSTLCSGNTLSLNLTYTSQCSPSYTWAGPNAFTSNSQNPTISNAQPINSGSYTVTVSCGTACPVSLTTSVTINQSPTTANAGSSQTICATVTTMNGNTPSVGTGSWTLISGSGTITSPTLANTGITAVGVGINIFAWTITLGNCSSTSTVLIQRDLNSTASLAGPNQTVCATVATLNGNNPAVGTGTWSLVSGAGTITSLNLFNSGLTALGAGVNVFQWTIGNGACPPTSSTVSVQRDLNPSASVAGPTICTCASTATLNANTPAVGSGSWTVISGPGLVVAPTSPSSQVITLGFGSNVFQWSISNGVCPPSTSTTEILHTLPPTVSNAGPNQSIACVNSATMAGNTPAIGIGTWSLVSGSGTFMSPNSPTSIVTGVGTGTNVYMWVISGGCCSVPPSTSTMAVINATAITVTAFASPTAVCNGFSTTVTGFGANSYTWTGSTFTGSIVQPSISVGAGSYSVVGVSGSCNSASSIVIYTMSPPILTLTASSYTHCPNKPISMSVSGASFYTWSPCAGGYLSICTGAGVNAFAPTTMTYTVVGNVLGCSASASIVISVIPDPPITATTNQSLICAGDAATLTASGGGNYTWTPSGNGTVNIVSPTVTTTYSVYGTGTNVCIGTGTVTQNVSPCTSLYSGEATLEQVKIFPNPFKDELKIVSEKLALIKLLDASGKEIMRKEIKGEVNINTSQLAKGIYFIHFIGNPSVKPIKVIKD